MITEQDGQIIVHELRPMSEAPKKPGSFILAARKNIEELDQYELGGQGEWYLDRADCSCRAYSSDTFIGFILPVIYKPNRQGE